MIKKTLRATSHEALYSAAINSQSLGESVDFVMGAD
jgi:hypothetical protein